MDSTQRTIKGLDGIERVYTFIPLTHRESIKVEYEFGGLVTTLVSNLAQNAGTLEKLLKSPEKRLQTDDLFFMSDIGKTLYSILPFDKLWELASIILRGAVIHVDVPGNAPQVVRVDDLDSCDYFTGKLDEIMLATLKGFEVSFPLLVSKLRGMWSKGSGASEKAPIGSKASDG